MNWFDWILIGWWALGALVTIAMVGQPRKPVEPGTAVMVVILNALLILGLVLTH